VTSRQPQQTAPPPTTGPQPSSRALALGAVGAGVLTALLRLTAFNGFENDHFMHLAWAQQMALGALPGRDFVEPGMPLAIVLSALVQWLWPGSLSEAILGTACLGIAGGFLCATAARLTRSLALGLVASAIALALYPRLYSYPKVLVPAVAVWLVLRYVERRSTRRLWHMAVWSVLAFLLRHDLGAMAAVSMLAGLLVDDELALRARIRSGARFVGMGLLLVAPYLAYLQWAEGLLEHIRVGTEFGKAEQHQVFWAGPSLLPGSDERTLVVGSWVLSAEAILFWLFHRPDPRPGLVRVAGPRPARTGSGCRSSSVYGGVSFRDPAIPSAGPLAGRGRGGRRGRGAGDPRDIHHRGAFPRPVAGGGRRHRHGLAVRLCHWRRQSVERGQPGRSHLASGLRPGTPRRRHDAARCPAALGGSVLAPVLASGADASRDRLPGALHDPPGPHARDVVCAGVLCIRGPWFAAGHAMFLRASFATEHDQARMLERLDGESVPVVLVNETEHAEFAQAFPRVAAHIAGRYTVRTRSATTTTRSSGWRSATTSPRPPSLPARPGFAVPRYRRCPKRGPEAQSRA